MGKLGKFQMIGPQVWKGLTTKNHLGQIYGTRPQLATDILVKLLAYQRGSTLESELMKYPTKTFDTDDDMTWNVVGSSRRNIPLVEARTETGTVVTSASGNIGVNTTCFYLVFAEDWFSKGEVIVGNLNEKYLFRVLDDVRMEGTNAVYRVELMGGNTIGVPAERLLAGERFSIEYAPVERSFSRKVGDIHFSSPMAMRNEWSTIRLQHKVGGDMHNARINYYDKLDKKVQFGVPLVKNATGNKPQVFMSDMWMHYVEYQFETEFSDHKNNLLMFGVSNRNSNGEYMNIGESGQVIRMGDGLLKQMEVSNTRGYSDFSLKYIVDFLYSMSQAKLGMGERRFVMKTGEKGAIQFHEEVMKVASGWTMWTLDNSSTGVIRKVQSPLHNNALSAGFQFVEYHAPNNVILTVEVDPWYDDPVRNKVQHHKGGPAMSYRYDIMYMGTMDQPNIFKCALKNTPELRGYQWGLRNPFTGEINNNNMSYDEDSAVMHRMATLGVICLDPTRTASLIPSELM